MFTFRYKVKIETDGNTCICRDGIVTGSDFVEAMRSLSEFYGDMMCDVLTLRMICDGEVIEIDEEYLPMVDKIEKEWVW